MPKRSSNGNASQRAGTAASRKRIKKDEPEDDSNTTSDAPANVQNNTELGIRDSNFYFEDGSVTLRVRHILFKVIHGSLLKAHSEDFFQKFNMCPQSDGSLTGGTCDEDAITIPEVQPSQFRNLMKIIYCLPLNSLALTRAAPNDRKAIAVNFDCYLDIATLSLDFGMEKLGQWANQELTSLVRDSGRDLADGFGTLAPELRSQKQDDLQQKWNGTGIPPATCYYGFRFIEAIWHAKSISDECLLYGALGVTQYWCARVGDVKFPLSFFAIQDLRKVAPSLYGFLFLLLLRCGNSAWMGGEFSQADRFALFSAQSFLTPLPKSLKDSIATPLFKKPSSDDFVGILANNPSKGDHDACPGEISSRWGKVFLAAYYREINGEQFSVSISALLTLPSRRFDFAIQLRWIKCQACHLKILGLLDRDMQEVFTRLAEYYKVHD